MSRDQFIRAFTIHTELEKLALTAYENQSGLTSSDKASLEHARVILYWMPLVDRTGPLLFLLSAIVLNVFKMTIFFKFDKREKTIFLKFNKMLTINNIQILVAYLLNFIHTGDSATNSLAAYSGLSCKLVSYSIHWFTSFQSWSVIVYVRTMKTFFETRSFVGLRRRTLLKTGSVKNAQNGQTSCLSLRKSWQRFSKYLHTIRYLIAAFIMPAFVHTFDLVFIDVDTISYGDKLVVPTCVISSPSRSNQILVIKHLLDLLFTFALPLVFISIESIHLIKASNKFNSRARRVSSSNNDRKEENLKLKFAVGPFLFMMYKIPIILMTCICYIYFNNQDTQTMRPDELVWRLRLKLLYSLALTVSYSNYAGLIVITMFYNKTFRQKVALLFKCNKV